MSRNGHWRTGLHKSISLRMSVSLLLGFKKIMFHIFPITNIISTQGACNELGLSYDDQSGYADLNSLPCVILLSDFVELSRFIFVRWRF